jgi:hypothetical protein
MPDDPTITRIRTVRHNISESYNHDVGELIAHYQELEKLHKHRMIEQDTSILSNRQSAHHRIQSNVTLEH